jgi:DNA-binding NarL/FixJ family response regulator
VSDMAYISPAPEPENIDIDLLGRAAQILADASIVAEAKAASWGAPTTTHGAPESSAPVSQGMSLYDELRERFEGCTTDAEMQRAIAIASVQLERAKHGPRHAYEADAVFRRRVLADYVGIPANEVAAWEQITTATVRKIRTDAKRHPSTGDPIGLDIEPIRWASIDERRARTAELAAAGLSMREIARRVGVDHSVVSRDLKRSA